MKIDIQLLSTKTQSLLTTSQSSDFFQEPDNYNDLIDCIIDHNHLYYIENSPIISDKEYDMLFQILKEFESLHPEYIRDDSPTQALVGQMSHLPDKGGLGGFEIQTEFKKSNHQTPILSLQNTYNSEDIYERYESITTMLNKKIEDMEDNAKKEELTTKIQNLDFLIEPKYDGLSIVLTYHDGKLYKAVTRGDGYTGDDVTENIKTIKNLPKTLPLPDKGGLGGFDNTLILR